MQPRVRARHLAAPLALFAALALAAPAAASDYMLPVLLEDMKARSAPGEGATPGAGAPADAQGTSQLVTSSPTAIGIALVAALVGTVLVFAVGTRFRSDGGDAQA